MRLRHTRLRAAFVATISISAPACGAGHPAGHDLTVFDQTGIDREDYKGQLRPFWREGLTFGSYVPPARLLQVVAMVRIDDSGFVRSFEVESSGEPGFDSVVSRHLSTLVGVRLPQPPSEEVGAEFRGVVRRVVFSRDGRAHSSVVVGGPFAPPQFSI